LKSQEGECGRLGGQLQVHKLHVWKRRNNDWSLRRPESWTLKSIDRPKETAQIAQNNWASGRPGDCTDCTKQLGQRSTAWSTAI